MVLATVFESHAEVAAESGTAFRGAPGEGREVPRSLFLREEGEREDEDEEGVTEEAEAEEGETDDNEDAPLPASPDEP